jgi:hypothetical protein
MPWAARLVGAMVFAGLLAPAPAHADVQSCVAASEKGQRARASGKLREAREQFVVCGADSCPALVRKDCIHWNGEIAASLPTVVFGAHDHQGRDLFDVTVSMDGEVLVKKLDGKSVTIDPGKHTFRFETSGLPSVTEVALVKEGERARVLNVTFDSPPPPPTPAATSTTTTTAPTSGDSDKGAGTKDDGHTPYPWIIVGIGAAAVAVGAAIALTAPSRPGNCDPVKQTCHRTDGESDDQFRQDQQRAGTSDSQPILGLAVAGVGAALVAAGLLWHFFEPTGESHSKSAGLRVAPWTSGKSSGLTLGARF